MKKENLISRNPITINHSLSSQQYYTYLEEGEQQSKYTQIKNFSTKFYPFYIVRRMDFKIDDEKKNEIKGFISCLW